MNRAQWSTRNFFISRIVYKFVVKFNVHCFYINIKDSYKSKFIYDREFLQQFLATIDFFFFKIIEWLFRIASLKLFFRLFWGFFFKKIKTLCYIDFYTHIYKHTFKIITNYFFEAKIIWILFRCTSVLKWNNEIYSIFFPLMNLFDYHKIFVSCKYVVQIYFFRTYFNIYLAYLNYFSMLNYLFLLDLWKKHSYDC